MAGVGAQVVFDALLVADVDEDAAEDAGARVFADGDGQSALHHVLDEAHGLQAHRLASGVGAGDDEDALAAVQFDVERHGLLAVAGERERQQGVARQRPVYQRRALEVGRDGVELPCQPGFGVDEVYLGQELVGVEEFPLEWSDFGGEFLQDADDFAALFPFQFAYAVVGFHHFGRFDEHGASRGGLVVYDAFYLAFQGRGDGDDEAPVAHGGRHVLVHNAVLLRAAQDAVQGARDAAFGGGQFAAYAQEFGRGRVLDFPVAVEYAVDAAHDLREHGDAFRQAVQGRIGAVVAFRFPLFAFVVAFVQELDDGNEGGERALQVEKLVFVQIGAFHPDAPDGRAHVEEVLGRKFFFAFHDFDEFPGLFLPLADGLQFGHELHLFHFLLSERAEAVSFQQAPYFVEPNLLFKILRVNHIPFAVSGCKVTKKRQKRILNGDFSGVARLSLSSACPWGRVIFPQGGKASGALGVGDGRKGESYFAENTRVLCGKYSSTLRRVRWRAARGASRFCARPSASVRVPGGRNAGHGRCRKGGKRGRNVFYGTVSKRFWLSFAKNQVSL